MSYLLCFPSLRPPSAILHIRLALCFFGPPCASRLSSSPSPFRSSPRPPSQSSSPAPPFSRPSFSCRRAIWSLRSARICCISATALRSSGSITTARFCRYVCWRCGAMSFGFEPYGSCACNFFGTISGLKRRGARSIFLYVEFTFSASWSPPRGGPGPSGAYPSTRTFQERRSEVTGL